MNKKLIQQLADGEILLENSNSFGESSRENIRKIIKLAFPKSPYVPLGDAKYYGRSDYNPYEWASYFPNLLVKQVPLSEFLKDDFVLPDKWCIKQHLSQEVCDWHQKEFKTFSSAHIKGRYLYLLNHKSRAKNCMEFKRFTGEYDTVFADFIPSGYTEITLEQFKEHVLKQETKVMKDRIITHIQANEIIDVACSQWKQKLAKIWAVDIVLEKEIKVSESFYQEMRKACTDSQNRVFDEIFGKDVEEFNTTNMLVGQILKIKNHHRYSDELILKNYEGFMLVHKPNETWVGDPKFTGELLPEGTEIIIKAK